MVFKILEFFWNWRFEETGSTSLFLTVWDGKLDMPKLMQDLSLGRIRTDFILRYSLRAVLIHLKYSWEEGRRLNKTSCGSLNATKRWISDGDSAADLSSSNYFLVNEIFA